MNSLNAAKIFLFLAAVLSALSAVYGGIVHKVTGFSASGICFAAFLILLFYDPAGEDAESASGVKKYKDYKERKEYKYRETGTAAHAVPSVPEPKQEVPQYRPMNLAGSFQNRKEPDLSKEEILNDKIKVLNKFASVASHDLKNPLSSMKNIAYYLRNSVKIEGEVPNKMLRMLSSEVDRMNNMIVELLDSTRVKQLNKGNSDLKSIINDAIEKQKDGKYNFETSLQQLQIYADPERMKQVFSSIIRNAEESMPDGGSITVKAYKSANEAYVEISDTGTGMDKETLSHCFDPMFSTKQARALGMSLTVSKQIVTMHGGTVKAESVPGKGSKFTVNLPLSV
jgi:signal transduction histidine kinase